MIRTLASRSTLVSGARRFAPPLSSFSPSFRPIPQFVSFFSTENEEPCKVGTCLDKMGDIMKDYRKANYAQTLYSRFVKEVVTAADADGDGFITTDEIRNLLHNIGASERMTPEEIDIVVTEAGGDEETHSVPVERVIEIMKERGPGKGPSVNSD